MMISWSNLTMRIPILVLASIGILAVSGRAQPREALHKEFWQWFQQHDSALFVVRTGSEPIVAELVARLHAVHPDLVFEFGPVTAGRRQFIISADGLRTAFPAVIALGDAAPEMERWHVVTFRPRRPPTRLELGGIVVNPEDVRVRLQMAGDRIRLTVAIPGFSSTKDHRFEQIGYLLLDHALGEYTMETRIGGITFVAPSAHPSGDWYLLKDLPILVDRVKVRLKSPESTDR